MASGVYRGLTAEQRAEERRHRLLDATLTVWSAAGPKVTMTAVCAEAGLIERYFYESFTRLDDALAAVLEEVADQIEGATQRAHDDAVAAGADVGARVRATVSALVACLEADPRRGRVAIVAAGSMPALRDRRTALLRRFARRTAEEAAQSSGDAGSPCDGRALEVAGLLFVGGLAELLHAWLDGTFEATTEEIVDAASRMYLALHDVPVDVPR